MNRHESRAPDCSQRARIFGLVLGTCHAEEHLETMGYPCGEGVSLALLARLAWNREASARVGDPAGRAAFIAAYERAYRAAQPPDVPLDAPERCHMEDDASGYMGVWD